MSFPKPPEKIVPFNSGPVAAHDIGRQFDEHRRGIAGIINFLKTIIRDDGVMRETSMPAPAANAALRRGGSITPAAVQPALPTGVLGPDAGGFFATDEQSAGPLAQDYAQVSIDWAEHMPDTIPNQTMAVMAITGQHWSSRWWANQAALSAGQIVGNYLPLAGGTMTGPLVIPVVANLNVGGGGTGQVLTAKDGSGALSWSTPSGTFIDAPSNSQYYSRYNGDWVVSPGGLTDAPNDATAYVRKSQAWSHLTHADITDWSAAVPQASTVAPVMDGTAAVGAGTTWARADHVHPHDASLLPLAGGTLTGALTLSGPPTLPLHAATKAYVDGGSFMPITGGTMTGPLVLAADPTAALGAATKQYVDAHAGVTDGSNAASGQIGEFLTNSHGPVAISWNSIAQAAGLALSAGDWDVWGTVILTGTGGTLLTACTASLSLTAGVQGAAASLLATPGYPANGELSVPVPMIRVNIATGQTIYCVATFNGSTGTPSVAGAINARRAR